MEVNIKAVDSFSHGGLHAHIGCVYPMEKATADELVKVGLVEILDTKPAKVEPAAKVEPITIGNNPDEEDLDDLVGGEKAATTPQNKMAPAPANKKK